MTTGLGIDADPSGAGSYTYSMVKSGPDVSPDEVEVAHLAAIEVMIMWDTNVLHVSHLTPPRSFYVGEEQGDKIDVRLLHPERDARDDARADRRRARRRALRSSCCRARRVRRYPRPGTRHASRPHLVGARAPVDRDVSGAHEFELPAGAKARMELDGSALVFQVSAVNAGKRDRRRVRSRSFEPAAFLYIGLSFLLHMGIVASLAFFMPRMSGDDSEDDRSRSDPDDAEAAQRRRRARAGREGDRAGRRDQRRQQRRRHRHARQGRRGFHGQPEHQGDRTQATASRVRRTTPTRTSRVRLRSARRPSSA